MASTPPKTNLFGAGGGSLDHKKSKGSGSTAPTFGSSSDAGGGLGLGGGVGGIGRIGGGVGNNDSAKATSKSRAASSWFEEDDELILSQLLLGEEESGESTTAFDGDLDAKLNRLRDRLNEDLSRATANGGWWTALLDTAKSSGFSCHSSSENGLSSPTTTTGEKKELPKSFNTPEGQSHLRALVDLLGISQERAVRITLASLRSFAFATGAAASSATTKTPKTGKDPVSTPPSASTDSDKENDDQNDGNDEEEFKLRSLLGTKELFHRVILRYRRQFLARLRVITESLRLEQEGEESGRKRVGKSCANFLDKLDSTLTLHQKKRGLFKLLLHLATGPPLPGMGANELPYSVDRLLRGGSNSSNALGGGEESLLLIRNESAEALVVLFYARIDGGVRRSDLFMVLEAAAGCGEYEFGMTANEYAGRGASGGVSRGRGGHDMDLGDSSSPEAMVENAKCRLDGLWGLISAECMGLWRTNNGNGNDNGGDGGWIGQHPFFSGLDLANAIEDGNNNTALGGKRGASLSLHTGHTANNNNSNKQAQQELEALCNKLRQLGDTVRGRRQAAYSQSRKRIRKSRDSNNFAMTDEASRDVHDAAEDDELWGVHAPEAVALLAFGLLLRLAHVSCPSNNFLSRLGEWGGEFAQTANDDCGAFAYLHRILEGMVLDPLKITAGNVRRGRKIGDEQLVRDLLRRGELEMMACPADDKPLALIDDGMEQNDASNGGDGVEEELVESDAASTVYASIGREILSATVCAFRTALLSLQSTTRAVENIGMLADLASAIHCNSKILCEQFWNGWEEFCQGGSGENDDTMNDGIKEGLLSNDEPMCYLLDASHSLAVSTLEELKNGGSEQPQAIIHYLKPLSTFLHLIASLCANSAMVQSILTSEFLPEALLESVISVIAALAPLVSSLSDASNNSGQQISAEEKSTIRHAAVAIRSISTLAYLGGGRARDWIRRSLARGSQTAGPARMICNIASQVLPTRSKQNSLEHQCCAALASSALNLLVDLLVDADVAFQIETLVCFSSSGNSSNFGPDRMSGFAPFVATGGDVTLAAMSILNCFAVSLARNVFDASSTSSGSVSAHIETMSGGVMVALDVLSSFVSSGEVTFPTSKVQVSTAHAILSSIVATLVSLKQIIYLLEDDEVRSMALAVRNDIVNSLTSSTPLGQVVAFLASAPLSLSLTKKAASSKELSRAMDAASYYRESNMDGGGKYGAWGRFVTPKRASQKALKRRTAAKLVAFSPENDDVSDNPHSDLDDVVVVAQSLLLVWGQHAEDIAGGYLSEEVIDGSDGQNLILLSPCALLLSKASPSSIQPNAADAGLHVANLNLISRFASTDDVLARGTAKSDSAVLSAKIVKMCLRHTNTISNDDLSQHDARIGISAFRVALGGGSHMFQVLLGTFDKLATWGDASEEGHDEHMERLVLMATIMLETVAVSVSSQPDLARAVLLGGENNEDWRLLDKIVSLVMSTSDTVSAPRDDQSKADNRVLNLRCLLTCACLHVVAELWKTCRLTCNRNSNFSSDSAHACGTIVSYLTSPNKIVTTSLIVDIIVELTRYSLLTIMSLDEKNSMHDQVSTTVVHQKCILLDLLTRSLEIITTETVSRTQTMSSGGIKFVEDLFDSGPMECWKVLLSSGDAPAASAASSWLTCFSSSVGRSHAPNWNIASFLHANPPEQDASTSMWCGFGSAARLAKDLSSTGSDSVSASFMQCNALHVLTLGEASFSASWATFFEIVTANVIATRPTKELCTLSIALAETTLAALASVSESQMISESLLSSQGFLERRATKPVGELLSLLLYSLKARRDILSSDEARCDCQSVMAMIGRLYESANKLFVMTQLGSVAPSEAVCSIRQKLLSCALMLMTDFESLPQGRRTRNDVAKYNDLRIGFTDLAVNALQSLEYVQLEANDDTAIVEEADHLPSKYGYGFGAVSHLGQEAAFQLLRVSLSLLSRLAPTTTIGLSSKLGDYQNFTYGVEFAACLKERRAVECIQYHLSKASTVASLTYQAVHAGSSSLSVSSIHNNAVDVVCLITRLFHGLIDAGSTIVDILLLLMENRCFRSLIDNPLLRTSCKTWTSNTDVSDNEVMPTAILHRGYYTSLPRHSGHTSSASKNKPSSQKDSVHFVWREVISIFSSLLRSARCQSQTYAKVDEPILRQLTSVTSVVLDFVCSYAEELFFCFRSMQTEARSRSNLSSRGGKTESTSFSSSIQSSSFAFTPNLLQESADISLLFAELCKTDSKNEFARQCGDIYERVRVTCLELMKVMSSFLGSIGNARELFLALSSASSTIMLDQPTTMFDAHPLLAEGIPNARHEAIRNAHFAHSCCILATAEDFSNSHIATTKAAETSGRDKSLEQSFQIQVNNKFIAEVEHIAGLCLFNAMAVLSDTHPASNSFISFSNEEALLLDVAAVITPGTTVAICAQTGAQQHLQRYLIQPRGGNIRYARTVGCDRSTRTISVEYADSGSVERHVPWSWIVGMEDTSKRQCVFSYLPTPKSMAETDTYGPPSLGHLILALKWCRYVGSTDFPKHIVKCVAERAAILLCTEVLLHDEIRDGTLHDDTIRRVNMQLLDLFDYADTESEGLNPKVAVSSHQRDKSLASTIGEDILGIVQINLKHQLRAACLEREEEQKMWEQNNSGWDNATWASSSKRQGRRSPFRSVRKTSSGDLS